MKILEFLLMESYSIFSFISGFFHFFNVWCFWDLSLFWYTTVVLSFLLPNNLPLCECATNCLFINFLIDICFVSSLGLFQINLLWTSFFFLIFKTFILFIFWPHHMTYRILVPWPVVEPAPSAVEAQDCQGWITTGLPGKSQLLWTSLNISLYGHMVHFF